MTIKHREANFSILREYNVSIAIHLKATMRQPLFIWLMASMVIARELIPITVDSGATNKDTSVSLCVQVTEDAERTDAGRKWNHSNTNHT